MSKAHAFPVHEAADPPPSSWSSAWAARRSTNWTEGDLLIKVHLDLLGRDGANLLFHLCSALYECSAIIITSNLKFGDWNAVMREKHLTTGLLDRLTRRAHILEFLGESFRFAKGASKKSLRFFAGSGILLAQKG